MLAEIEDRELPEVESWSDYQAKLRKESRQEGREAGRREGRRAGRREGVRRSVLKILEHRFGRVPADIRQRVNGSTSMAELDLWLSRALDVDSPDQLKP